MELVLCLLFALYLAPFVVAARREHERLGAVLALNLLVGWTGIGWLLVLRWARRGAPPPPEPAVRARRGHLRLLEPPEGRRADPPAVRRVPPRKFPVRQPKRGVE
jgi:hypothetical protein